MKYAEIKTMLDSIKKDTPLYLFKHAIAVLEQIDEENVDHYGFTELCCYIRDAQWSSCLPVELDEFAYNLNEIINGIKEDTGRRPTLNRLYKDEILGELYDYSCLSLM